MNVEIAAVVIKVGISLAILWVFHFWLYKDLMIDIFRQKIFILRDELFDYAASGHIDFNHPAYGTMRRAMNGFIRFAHRLDLLHAVFIMLFVDEDKLEKYDHLSFDARLSEEMKTLPPDVSATMHGYRKKIQMEVIFHCLRISPFLSVLFIVPILIAIAVSGINRFKKYIIVHMRGIETTAFAEGH